MHFEFYQSLYEAEWARKDEIQSAASVSIGVLAAVIAALGYVARTPPKASLLAILFWIAFALALIALACSVYQLVRVQVGYVYRRLAYPSQLLQSELDLERWYAENSQSERPCATVKEDFESQVSQRLAEAADQNTRNNITRGEHLHRANGALVVGMIATGLAAMINGANLVRERLQTSRIPSTADRTPLMRDNQQSPAVQPGNAPATSPPPSTPRPTVPPNQDQKTQIDPPNVR